MESNGAGEKEEHLGSRKQSWPHIIRDTQHTSNQGDVIKAISITRLAKQIFKSIRASKQLHREYPHPLILLKISMLCMRCL